MYGFVTNHVNVDVLKNDSDKLWKAGSFYDQNKFINHKVGATEHVDEQKRYQLYRVLLRKVY